MKIFKFNQLSPTIEVVWIIWLDDSNDLVAVITVRIVSVEESRKARAFDHSSLIIESGSEGFIKGILPYPSIN